MTLPSLEPSTKSVPACKKPIRTWKRSGRSCLQGTGSKAREVIHGAENHLLRRSAPSARCLGGTFRTLHVPLSRDVLVVPSKASQEFVVAASHSTAPTGTHYTMGYQRLGQPADSRHGASHGGLNHSFADFDREQIGSCSHRPVAQ